MKPLILSLPWPPSMNHYWRSIIIKGSVRVLLSKEGRAYQNNCLAAVLSKHGMLQPLAGRLSVSIQVFAPDRRRRDLDNMHKGILDALKIVRAIQDDSQIDVLSITRHKLPLREGGEIQVSIEQLPDDTPLLDELK